MKMKNIFSFILLAIMPGLFSACLDDLDRFPTNDITAETVYATYDGYRQVLAKVYGSYALSGNKGPDGSPDVQGLDEGSNADFLRNLFNLQVMTTDEAICAWGDMGIPDLNYMNWSSSNPFTTGMYYRCMFQITMVNEFLRESTDDRLGKRGISGDQAVDIRLFRAEVRFLRAFQYWVMLDLFGNPPFVDENSPIGKYLPEQKTAKEIFGYIESELRDIEGALKDPRANEYGRVDRAACHALLARLYLNAETYAGAGKYTEAATYSKKVIDAGYALKTPYEDLFKADNQTNNPEVILSINYDGLKSRGNGGTSFLINASFKNQREDDGGAVGYNDYFGMNSNGWGGNRTRSNLTGRFDMDNDRRALFRGVKPDVETVNNFEDGLATAKFRNVTSAGTPGSNKAESFADTDFPLFRLAEMYLTYAEAIMRGGSGGTHADALAYFNKIRERAYGNTSGNLSSVSLDDILDERARELYWEGFRRTDLIRYGRYTGDAYLWQWKGGVKSGRAVEPFRELFPLPSSDVTANPNLKQNTGY
jgi:hypothetical protein